MTGRGAFKIKRKRPRVLGRLDPEPSTLFGSFNQPNYPKHPPRNVQPKSTPHQLRLAE